MLDWVFDDNEQTWGSNQESFLNYNSADHSGTSNDPKLVVEHSALSTPNSRLTISLEQTT